MPTQNVTKIFGADTLTCTDNVSLTAGSLEVSKIYAGATQKFFRQATGLAEAVIGKGNFPIPCKISATWTTKAEIETGGIIQSTTTSVIAIAVGFQTAAGLASLLLFSGDRSSA